MSPLYFIRSVILISFDKKPLSSDLTCDAKKTLKYGLVATDVIICCGNPTRQKASDNSASSPTKIADRNVEIEEDKIANVQTGTIDLLPEHNFIPGMGSPLTIFTLQEHPEWGGTVNLTKSRTVYLNLKKFFLDYALETNLRTFFDVINKGRFIEVEGIYDYSESWKISSAINFITGNENSGDSYPFNPMESFSHFRLEFIYSF